MCCVHDTIAVAERAFRLITDIPELNTTSREDDKYKITFHYEYLDDFYEDKAEYVD